MDLFNDGVTNNRFSNEQNTAYIVYGNTTFFLPYNPNSLTFSYTLNTAAFDTLGGRVLQILSAKIDTIDFEGEAASRTKLLKLYQNIKNVQDWQVSYWNAAELYIPTKGWHFSIWVQGFPALGWTYETVTYPYSIQFLVNEDYGNIIEKITSHALDHLTANVGFSSTYTGVVSSNIVAPPINRTTSQVKNPANNTSGAKHQRSYHPRGG